MTEESPPLLYWALQVAYDGSQFAGYQVQPGLRTVQGELEAALNKLLGAISKTNPAGRTDAGVHAYAQLVNFNTPSALPLDRMLSPLRRLLPDDIGVVKAWSVPPDFHARFKALARHYRYRVALTKQHHPLARQRFWAYPHTVDLQLLTEVWEQLVGKAHFGAFCKQSGYTRSDELEVLWTRVRQQGPWLEFDIMADRFLHNMVRALVGTALDIARGRFPADHIQTLLAQPDRAQIGLTAPAHGLYFYNVVYPPEYGLTLLEPLLQLDPEGINTFNPR